MSDLYTLTETAHLLRCSRRSVERLVRAGRLRVVHPVPGRISEQLGHANPSLTAKVYAHVVPSAQRAAVASLERSGS